MYQLIAVDTSAAELKTLCLHQWGGAKVVQARAENESLFSDYAYRRRLKTQSAVVGRQASGAYLLRKGPFFFEATTETIAGLLPNLDWLVSVPTALVRLSKINRRDALAADFQGVPFEPYIVCDNLYQGYLQTRDESLLDELANVLYPSGKYSILGIGNLKLGTR